MVKRGVFFYGACLLVAMSAYSEPSSMRDFRIFTATDGRVIEARVLTCDSTGGKVQIERNNRKKVWVQADIFSKEDQAYIREWIVASQFLSTSKFRISAEKQKGKKSPKGTPIHYELTLDNRTSIALENIVVDYRIMIEENGYSGRDDSERCAAGKIELETLPAGQSVKKKTENELLHLQYITQTEITYYSDGSSDVDTSKNKIQEDKAAGIWLKIQGPELDGHPVIREFLYPADLGRKFSWTEYARRPSAAAQVDTAKRSSNSKAAKILKEAHRYRKGDGVKKDASKAMELFKEAYELEPKASTAVDIGSVYLRVAKLRDYELAEQWMDKAAEQGSSLGYNSLAMFYATSKNPSLRNGEKAVKYALAAVEVDGAEDWLLDTLACAYARNGQFMLAAATQKTALEMAGKRGSWSNEQLSSFEARLTLFSQGKAYPPD